ncbi:MAG: hypothetical protein IKP46_06505 [Bacteroidales bacterium]|nr:hypothetical protein [Bacteroidales bacterium]
MRHRFLLLIMPLLLIAVAARAQGIRVVRGAITDLNGKPLKSAVIVTEDKEQFRPAQDGSFEIRISTSNHRLAFWAKGYTTVTREIDGSFLMVKMDVDHEAIRKMEQEAQAREEQLRLAEEARLAAIEKARRDSLFAVETARKEAEAKAKAEETARVKAEKKAERHQKDSLYNEKYRNKGLEHSVDVLWSYPIDRCVVYYYYSGYRQYGALHPLELDYTLSWRFNRWVSVGVGAGVSYNLKSITIVNDSFSPVYGDFKEKQLDVPVFAAVKVTPLRSRIRPVIGVSGGYYILSRTMLLNADLGCEFRITRRVAAHILFSARTTPYPYFSEEQGAAGYHAAFSPSVKIGFSL